jgi:hypothetical protein
MGADGSDATELNIRRQEVETGLDVMNVRTS